MAWLSCNRYSLLLVDCKILVTSDKVLDVWYSIVELRLKLERQLKSGMFVTLKKEF
jgi:hypothetical protein